jgi:hypothetical protein
VNPPAVIVAKGEPSDPELVALVTALTAMSIPADDAGPPPEPVRSAWSDRARMLGSRRTDGDWAWRRSYLP